MRERFTELFKKTNEKKLRQLIVLLAAGVMLMVLSGVLSRQDKVAKETAQKPRETQADLEPSYTDYRRELEERLTFILSEVEGAGRVSALMTLSWKGEVELALNTSYEKIETGDGEKPSVTERRESTHVLVQGKDGLSQPIIIKEIEPKIEGVLIVAEGGDNGVVKAQLTKAAGALLNIPAHKIEVLKMREE